MKITQIKPSSSLKIALYSAFFGMSLLLSPLVQQSTVSAADGCGGVDTAYFKCSQTGTGGVENSGLWGILTVILNIMLAGVGILAVGGIVYGSILYASAQDNQSQVKQAMDIFKNVTIGLVAFALMYAVIEFIIPGGVF